MYVYILRGEGWVGIELVMSGIVVFHSNSTRKKNSINSKIACRCSLDIVLSEGTLTCSKGLID